MVGMIKQMVAVQSNFKAQNIANTLWAFATLKLQPSEELMVVMMTQAVAVQGIYSASRDGREVNPLGMITHGQRHKPRACQRQGYKPRTFRSMVNTLQGDRLARITGLSSSYSATHPQPPNGVPPCLVLRIDFGRGEGQTHERFGIGCINCFFLVWNPHS